MPTDDRAPLPSGSAADTHLIILQGIISRMAANSHSCKTWAVTLAAAVLIIAVNTRIDGLALLALLPGLLLGWLDIYYLGLERAFRNSYNNFAAALRQGSDVSGALYVMEPTCTDFTTPTACFKSPSIWPFYTVLTAVPVIVTLIIHFTDL